VEAARAEATVRWAEEEAAAAATAAVEGSAVECVGAGWG
jgi:hypothetical protein